MTYVYLLHNDKPINKKLIESHVEHLKQLHNQGRLILCGPFTDYPGGMVAFTAEDLPEALKIANSDPFIASGVCSYEIRTLEAAKEENKYLLED